MVNYSVNSPNIYASYSEFVPISKKFDFESLFEDFSIIASLIGPFLLLLYFILSNHVYLHFNSVRETDLLDTFALLYGAKIIYLSKLLFLSSLGSGIGVLLAGIHENMTVFVFCLFCFLISIGYYVPTFYMYIA